MVALSTSCTDADPMELIHCDRNCSNAKCQPLNIGAVSSPPDGMRCHQSDEGIWNVMACFPLIWNVFIVVLGLPPATHAEFCAGGCVFSFSVIFPHLRSAFLIRKGEYSITMEAPAGLRQVLVNGRVRAVSRMTDRFWLQIRKIIVVLP